MVARYLNSPQHPCVRGPPSIGHGPPQPLLGMAGELDQLEKQELVLDKTPSVELGPLWKEPGMA